jgi:hypothetical protein
VSDKFQPDFVQLSKCEREVEATRALSLEPGFVYGPMVVRARRFGGASDWPAPVHLRHGGC